jgi:hypothetical protein
VILVCSPGKLPQIIRIDKFHAWLLMIGWMLCVLSCYWLVPEEYLVCGPARLIRTGESVECLLVIGRLMCPSLLLAGVIGACMFSREEQRL